MKHRPTIDKFNEKWVVDPNTNCYNWSAATNVGGYGIMWFTEEQKLWTAHRLSWTLANGAIPKGMNVLHKCDNPQCVNPQHLFLGTQSDNVQDMNRKGRGMIGTVHKREKLTPDIVRHIRNVLIPRGISLRSIADTYGVNPTAISDVKHNKTWKDIK